jgi:hypothetical protein
MLNQCYTNVGAALDEVPAAGTMIHVLGNAIDNTLINLPEIHIKIHPDATLSTQEIENHGIITVWGYLEILGL